MKAMRTEKKNILRVFVALGSLALGICGWILLGRFRQLGYVDSAIGSLRSLVNAENQYAHTHPDIGFTCKLPPLPSDELPAGLIRDSVRNGYAFTIADALRKTDNGRTPNIN